MSGINLKHLLNKPGKLFISTEPNDFSNLKRLAGIKGLGIDYQQETTSITTDDMGKVKERIKTRKLAVKCNGVNFDLQLLQQLQQVDDYRVIPGGSASKIFNLKDGKQDVFYSFPEQSCDGAKPTAITIPSLSEGTNYTVAKNSGNGKYGIILAADFTGTKEVAYTIIEAAGEELAAGLSTEIKPITVRIESLLDDGRTVQIDLPYCFKKNGFGLDFIGKEDDDTAQFPIEITAEKMPESDVREYYIRYLKPKN